MKDIEKKLINQLKKDYPYDDEYKIIDIKRSIKKINKGE